jgi:hypothetical protein
VFSNDEKDKMETLSAMARLSVDRCWGNKVEAKERFKEWLGHDNRFAGYDHDKLAERTMLCRSNGAALDLTDPTLRGLPPRPLSRSGW